MRNKKKPNLYICFSLLFCSKYVRILKMKIILTILLSYLLGSVPIGYIMVRVVKGVDIRSYGSGNIGATNVMRVLGKVPGIITLIIDALKGFIAVIFISALFGLRSDLLKIACALAVIAGHNWTVFLKFRGGKGVATTAGALIGLVPVVFLSSFCVWCIIFIIWKYVSLSSIFAAISLPGFLILYREPFSLLVLGIVIAVIALIRHKENIKRLLKGEEKKITL